MLLNAHSWFSFKYGILSPEALLEEAAKAGRSDLPTPREISSILDQYVIGQGYAKKALAVAVHNHYKRLSLTEKGSDNAASNDVEVDKSNVLLIGPTGSGKTLLARSLAARPAALAGR